MKLPIYWVDAFTDKVFGGNPAAVVPLDSWLDDALLQRIANENGLSETAFFVRTGPARAELRWFTPAVEVDLCGHATLATAHVLFNELGQSESPGRVRHEVGTPVRRTRRASDRARLPVPPRGAGRAARGPASRAAPEAGGGPSLGADVALRLPDRG